MIGPFWHIYRMNLARLPEHSEKCAACETYSPRLSWVRLGRLTYRLCESCKRKVAA